MAPSESVMRNVRMCEGSHHVRQDLREGRGPFSELLTDIFISIMPLARREQGHREQFCVCREFRIGVSLMAPFRLQSADRKTKKIWYKRSVVPLHVRSVPI